MSVQLAAEIWNLMRESVSYEDKEELAESVVGILVDHGYDLDDIKYEFSNDSDIISAIKYYADETETEEEEFDEEYKDEDDEW